MLLKVVLSAVMAALFAAHVIWPRFKLDVIALALVILAASPWLGALFKTVKVGDVELTLREYKTEVNTAEREFREHASRQFEKQAYKTLESYKAWETYYHDDRGPHESLADALALVHYWLRKVQRQEGLDMDGADASTPEQALESLRSCAQCKSLKDEQAYQSIKEGIALIRRGLAIQGMTKAGAEPAIKYALSIMDYLDVVSVSLGG